LQLGFQPGVTARFDCLDHNREVGCTFVQQTNEALMVIKNVNLPEVIEDFTRLASDFSDADLEKPWVWEDYNEGVRFAFFRNYEDLCFPCGIGQCIRFPTSRNPTGGSAGLISA
jgi:hypothetical protein